ncbi:Protein smg7 [Dinochytrium kinnereticum]|nr:Protein smg7 [Dinochytrium kinnereticum]
MEPLLLKKEAQVLEKQLSEWETNKRRERTITLKDGFSEKLRIALLEIYEDMLTSDGITAYAGKNLDDRLWNVVFYSRIEELRSVIGKFQMDRNGSLQSALDELARHLDLAIAFYQTFILSLLSRLNADPIVIGVDILMNVRENSGDRDSVEALKDIRFNLVHKSIIFLGDIARYRSMYLPPTDIFAFDPNFIYKQAIYINPNHGKPHSQLAILSTTKKDYLSVIYWYSLSLLNKLPFPVATKNLLTFHAKTTSKWTDVSDTSTGCDRLSRLFIRYHREVVFPDDNTLSKMDAAGCTLEWFEKLEKEFAEAVWESVPSDEKACLMMRMAVILVVGFATFAEKFKKTDVIQLRQKIRYLQSSILSLLLSIAARSMTSISEYLTDLSDQSMDLFALDESGEMDPVFLYLKPVAMICGWLTQNLEAVVQFRNYTATGTPLSGLGSTLWTFSRNLSTLVNFLSAFADMDGSVECLPEDLDLLGLTTFHEFYKKLSSQAIVRELKGFGAPEVERVLVRISRVANLAKVMSENKEATPFFIFDEKNDARFMVLDAESKRLERDKVSKALAVEFLKNQIGSMETSLQRMKEVTIPIIIPDVQCYIQNLKFVKTVLMSRSAVVIIPQDVLHNLDRLKKGTDLSNVRAREAIRYLEQRFKYRSVYLRAQQDNETADLPALSQEDNLPSIPRPYRDLLKCCLYYRDKVAPRPVDGDDVTFALVTDDVETGRWAAEVGVGTGGRWKPLVFF